MRLRAAQPTALEPDIIRAVLASAVFVLLAELAEVHGLEEGDHDAIPLIALMTATRSIASTVCLRISVLTVFTAAVSL